MHPVRWIPITCIYFKMKERILWSNRQDCQLAIWREVRLMFALVLTGINPWTLMHLCFLHTEACWEGTLLSWVWIISGFCKECRADKIKWEKVPKWSLYWGENLARLLWKKIIKINYFMYISLGGLKKPNFQLTNVTLFSCFCVQINRTCKNSCLKTSGFSAVLITLKF